MGDLLQFADSVSGEGILIETSMDTDNGEQLSAFAAFNYSDSAVITFDKQKRQIYINNGNGFTAQPQQRNILLDSAYVVESEELYRFTFTEEDYENAEWIEEYAMK